MPSFFNELKLQALQSLMALWTHHAHHGRHKKSPKISANIIHFKTRGPVMDIEDWLEENADGIFATGIESVDDESGVKTIKIVFENESDKNRFLAAFKSEDRTMLMKKHG